MSRTLDSVVSQATVADAKTGDQLAFARIVAAYHDDMVRVACVVGADPDGAQEAVQAAWAVAWRKLDSLRDPDRLRPWLMVIAANESRRRHRAGARRSVREVSLDPDLHGVASYATDPAQRDSEADLLDALRRLEADDRRLIALRYAAGLSSSEIGLLVGMTGGGVRARLGRLLDRLREDLSGG